jgi:hypothetical protein
MWLRQLLRPPALGGSQRPIVRRIAVDTSETLDWAVHVQRIALNRVGNPLPGPLGAVGIKLDAVAKHFGAAGDSLERHTIADTGISRRRSDFRKQEKRANAPRFRQWKRVEAETRLAGKQH